MNNTSRQIRIWDLDKLRVKFNRKVQVTEGCWLWTGSKNKRGYGLLSVKSGTYIAHRMALHLRGVRIPDGLLALHHCNNPPCVNPDHLYVGTQVENMQQASREGRMNNQTKTCCSKCGGGYSHTPNGRRYCRPCRDQQMKGRHSCKCGRRILASRSQCRVCSKTEAAKDERERAYRLGVQDGKRARWVA